MNPDGVSVLIVFANPSGTDFLQLGTEERAIRESIRLGRYREKIRVETCHAATVHDLRRALLDSEYQIVHFSGHGSEDGIILETEQGEPYSVPEEAFAELLKSYPSIQCVLLNACYTLTQGEKLSFGVPYTIVMEGPIGDQASIEFTRGFYDALVAGKSYEFAYHEGRRTVSLAAPSVPFYSLLLKSYAQPSQEQPISPSTVEAPSPPEVETAGNTLEVQFPYAVKIELLAHNRQLRLPRLELRNSGQMPIPLGWQGKIVLLKPINFRVCLLDTIVLPAVGPGKIAPIGPFTVDVPLDISVSRDLWHVELYAVDPREKEYLLLRSPSISFSS